MFHGQSNPSINEESKGSIAIFLTTPDNKNGLYALMAYHVLSFEGRDESRVITPGGLDSLTRLLAALTSKPPDNDFIGDLLDVRDEPSGWLNMVISIQTKTDGEAISL